MNFNINQNDNENEKRNNLNIPFSKESNTGKKGFSCFPLASLLHPEGNENDTAFLLQGAKPWLNL